MVLLLAWCLYGDKISVFHNDDIGRSVYTRGLRLQKYIIKHKPTDLWQRAWVWFAVFTHKYQTLVLCLLVVLQISPVSKWNITRMTSIWVDTRARLPKLCQTRLVIILPVALCTLIHRRLSVAAHVSHDMLRIQRGFVINSANRSHIYMYWCSVYVSFWPVFWYWSIVMQPNYLILPPYIGQSQSYQNTNGPVNQTEPFVSQ